MFWHFTLFRCKFDSPQVKWYLMPRLMNLVHHLAHELPNDLRLRILGKKKNFMAPFYGWGSTASRLEPLRGGSLLFTTNYHLLLITITNYHLLLITITNLPLLGNNKKISKLGGNAN